jgi:hypothetical protein
MMRREAPFALQASQYRRRESGDKRRMGRFPPWRADNCVKAGLSGMIKPQFSRMMPLRIDTAGR